MTNGVGGLSLQHLRDLESTFRRTLTERVSVRVFLFGSRARGDHQRYSDVDLLIEGPIEPRCLRQLKDALAESNLPFKCDVVAEEEVFEHYREQIDSEKKLLFTLTDPDQSDRENHA